LELKENKEGKEKGEETGALNANEKKRQTSRHEE